MTDNKGIIYADQIERRLAEIGEQLVRLEVERDTLRQWLTKAVHLPTSNGTPHDPPVQLKPQQALLAHVRNHPGQLSGRIVSEVERLVDTTSTNRRGILQTTLGTLARTGRIRRDEDGRHWPVDDEPELIRSAH